MWGFSVRFSLKDFFFKKVGRQFRFVLLYCILIICSIPIVYIRSVHQLKLDMDSSTSAFEFIYIKERTGEIFSNYNIVYFHLKMF